MRPSFLPRLVNGPFDDPGLFIPFVFKKRAIIFDLGDIHSLSSRDILKISHVFISHTHMDHFIGFDRLLRLFLGREQQIYLYGPEGFLKNVEGKLAGYSWNLVSHYSNVFVLSVTEVHADHMITRNYACRNRFMPVQEDIKQPFNGLLFKEAALSIRAEVLDHSIPCLGFTLEERFHVNIMKEHVAGLGLEIGPWLNEFKQALYNNTDPDSEFEVQYGRQGSYKKRFILGELAKRIAIITPGQKVSYIVDAVYSKSNEAKMVELAKNADHLFIEAAFLEKHRDIAKKKYHLTAWQAGSIAGKAGVKQVTPFHFSPRYKGLEQVLEKETMDSYHRHIIRR